MSWEQSSSRRTSSSVFFGIFIAAIGILIFLDQVNVIEFQIRFWPLFLIGAGVFSGIKNGFDRLYPFVLIMLGILFLIPKFMVFGVSSEKLVWPSLLIFIGSFIALKSKSRAQRFDQLRRERSGMAMSAPTLLTPDQQSTQETANSTANPGGNPAGSQHLNIEAIFGGRKELVTSKEFLGCNATAICGGVEINLMQADSMIQPMVVDLRVIFGGVELIVPSHWEIINEVDVLFGGIEDKRHLRTSPDLQNAKQLILRGNVSFGGLELKSY
ncbi:MAG: DUF5668 domain-containing protein [Chitinophagaceae bacterium]